MALLEKPAHKSKEIIYLIFRIGIGLLFLFHGLDKLGLLGKEISTGFMLFIGIAELAGGLFIMLGFLTRISAIGTAVVMIGAYIQVHLSQALLPIANRGELALVYLLAFVLIFVYGSGKYGLDHLIFKKELF